MNEFVTDTHALLWHILQSERLSKNDVRIYIPNIVLVEIVYLMEKAKISNKSLEKLINLLDRNPNNYQMTQITVSTIRTMQSLQRQLIPDMPDRIITATAVELGLPLITKDSKIIKANVIEIIW
jgi:PIN domain nuclease of toxin-antitoxin system